MKGFVFTVKKVRIWSLCLFCFSGVLLWSMAMPLSGESLSSAVVGEAIRHGDESKPSIAFACNVFWGEEYLPQMLSTLAKEDVRMTFFIGGTWAKQYPDHLKAIVAGGHELGNHSYSHPHPLQITTEKNREQIRRAEEVIAEITGVRTQLYAPPYGECDERVIHTATELGYQTILWSIDTIDWQKPSPATIKQRVHKKMKNGAIVLMHPTRSMAEALPSLIRELKEKGYAITTVSEVCATDKYQ